tara:strand:+ start:1920 stop:2219 length:300 start_codon:yes stop_codon:yes gene_type:complete
MATHMVGVTEKAFENAIEKYCHEAINALVNNDDPVTAVLWMLALQYPPVTVDGNGVMISGVRPRVRDYLRNIPKAAPNFPLIEHLKDQLAKEDDTPAPP